MYVRILSFWSWSRYWSNKLWSFTIMRYRIILNQRWNRSLLRWMLRSNRRLHRMHIKWYWRSLISCLLFLCKSRKWRWFIWFRWQWFKLLFKWSYLRLISKNIPFYIRWKSILCSLLLWSYILLSRCRWFRSCLRLWTSRYFD